MNAVTQLPACDFADSETQAMYNTLLQRPHMRRVIDMATQAPIPTKGAFTSMLNGYIWDEILAMDDLKRTNPVAARLMTAALHRVNSQHMADVILAAVNPPTPAAADFKALLKQCYGVLPSIKHTLEQAQDSGKAALWAEELDPLIEQIKAALNGDPVPPPVVWTADEKITSIKRALADVVNPDVYHDLLRHYEGQGHDTIDAQNMVNDNDHEHERGMWALAETIREIISRA